MKERISIWMKIVKENHWLMKKISKALKISTNSIYKIFSTWKWKIENKEKILKYLEKNNYVRVWQYIITEFFEIK